MRMHRYSAASQEVEPVVEADGVCGSLSEHIQLALEAALVASFAHQCCERDGGEEDPRGSPLKRESVHNTAAKSFLSPLNCAAGHHNVKLFDIRSTNPAPLLVSEATPATSVEHSLVC